MYLVKTQLQVRKKKKTYTCVLIIIKIALIEKESDLDEECTYLCGNSLGLMPKRSRELINEELTTWGQK